MNAIEARQLTKRFGELTAVDGLSFDIPTGRIFGFLGPNGAGKSTTIRMLCGVLPPTSGEARIQGLDILRETRRIKPLIGYMSQSFGLYTDLTVEENLRFYSTLYLDFRTARRRCEEVIASLAFEPHRSRLAAQLSGGWRQRLALGCSLVHDPKIIFLDEPTAGIDPISRRLMWDYLYNLSERGKTLFVTTHYMEEAERCHRLGFIWEGKLAALGSPAEIRAGFGLYEIVVVKTPALNEAFRKVRDLSGVVDANLYGDELRVGVTDAQEAVVRIRAALERSALTVQEIKRVPPSLEDVFVALSRKTYARQAT